MAEEEKPKPWHGTVVGVANCGVIGYNCNATNMPPDTADAEPYDHVSYVKDSLGRLQYAGHKWQCVEFARRWWISQLDVYLPSIGRACDIFAELTKVRNLSTPSHLDYVHLDKYTSGETTVPPQVHDVIIWKKTERQFVGHIAVVCEVTPDYLRVAEQNVDNDIMWKGGTFTRQFSLRCDPATGVWTMVDEEDSLFGWVRVNKATHDAPPAWEPPAASLFPHVMESSKEELEHEMEFGKPTFFALSKFVGQDFTDVPVDMKWAPFMLRVVDYGLAAFLNVHHQAYGGGLVRSPWTGYGPETFDRTAIIRKLQDFLILHAGLSEVGRKGLALEVTGVWDTDTTRALQHMLNKIRHGEDFYAALNHARL